MIRARRRLLMFVIAVLVSAAPAAAQLQATLVANGFAAPIAFVQDPSDPTVQVVVEQGGRVRALKNSIVQSQDYLDLSSVVLFGGEQGLLGFAFAPDYGSSGRVFVNYINKSGNTVVARFKRSAQDPLRADPAGFAFVWPGGLAFIVQPFANHNGGNMAFGPDGFLYVGLGDGGSGNDPAHRAQDPQTLLGKMLRLDVSVPDGDTRGYRIPPGNPFAGQAGVLGEIWSFGLRNPWRWSFDNPARGGTGAMLIADVGQNAWEEVDYEPAGRGGRNYGWRNREGAHDNVTNLPPFFTPLTEPIHEYSHAVGGSITGGFVYRGSALGTSFNGRYFFGDFVTSRIWSIGLTVQGNGEATTGTLIEHTSDLGAGATNPSSFGVDAGGEIYVVTYGGAIYRIGFAGTLPPPPPPPPPPPGSIPESDSDFDADGKPDLVWEHDDGFLHVWFMDGRNRKSGRYLTPMQVNPAWRIMDADDFNGDGQADLLWQHLPTGTLYLWLMDGTRLTTGLPLSPGSIDPAWRIVATGDFNDDGKADILFQELPTGRLTVWMMNGVNRQSIASISPDQVGPDWRVVGTADLNRDGKIDLVFQNIVSGSLNAWLMNGPTLGVATPFSPDNIDPQWRVVAVADFDRDGHADLVWQHPTTGELVIWYLNETVRSRSESLVPQSVAPAWHVVGGK